MPIMDIQALLTAERDAILARCDRIVEASGLSQSTISGHLLNDGKGIKRLKGGGGLHPNSLEKIKSRLAKLEAKYGVQPAKADAA